MVKCRHMHADDFIRKWSAGSPAHGLGERAGAQAHFIDLCRVLGVPEPGDPESYCFERGLTRTGSTGLRTDGFADVWKRGCFAWEYKAPGRSLEGALKQLMMYALPLESPPLLVVSDRQLIEVHTHFTGTPSERHVFRLDEITRPEVQQRLRALWLAPDSYKPRLSNREITEQAARTFAGSAERLRAAGVAPEVASHFLTQCVFCFFAEDVGLLPGRLFERLVGVATSAEKLRAPLRRLFEAMRDGGLFGVDDVPWFNGGLFQRIEVPVLAAEDLAALRAASGLDWSAIDATIFGTLFERGLDPAKRSQLGANFTDPVTIMRLVEPVVQRPLLAEWAGVTPKIEAALGKSKRHGDKAWRDAQAAFAGFLERLRNYRVLDPACGSGNFLYLALKCLKDIEHQVNLEAEALGLQRQHDMTGPHNVLGIELNDYAAELARVTVWIGELQWRIQHGYPFKLNPVLDPLDQIECRDAVLGPDGREAAWPQADVVVGNPPFVGDKKMRGELGDAYTEALRAAYKGRVPGGADLVCYWFERARSEIEAGRLQRAGLVATNSIRQSTNREVLRRVLQTARIFDAWADEPWINDGAAVRVSLVAFGKSEQWSRLNGDKVKAIHADLSAEVGDWGLGDMTMAKPLAQNDGVSFFGLCLAGPFLVTGSQAREWLTRPNPNGESNALVLTPIWNGKDVTERSADRWAVDFGGEFSEQQAMLFDEPFAFVSANVLPTRASNNRPSRARWWFRHGETRPGMRRAIAGLSRCIATVERAKHRVFVWLPRGVAAEHRLVVLARSDDTTFGMLSSRMHTAWALASGSTLEDRPGYNTKVCFLPFPFPAGLTPADTAHQRTETLPDGAVIPADLPSAVRPHAEAIAHAAARLVALRDAWLNPPEWTERVPEVVPLGMTTSPYPDRIVARPGFENDLAKRTLTNLYNQRPAWLAQAHATLDTAVAAAYGWAEGADLPDDEILRRLLALNRERAGK
jgi:methylase of polypeptide subunit release factors